MIVVSNTSPLIFLSKIEKLDLIKKLYKKVNISEEVFKEINSKKSEEVNYFNKSKIYKIHKLKNIKKFNLGEGEEATITLALKLKADLVLLDDQKARFIVDNLNIKYIGTIGILLLSLKKELIKHDEFKNLINKLMDSGYRIDINIYTKITEEAEKYK